MMDNVYEMVFSVFQTLESNEAENVADFQQFTNNLNNILKKRSEAAASHENRKKHKTAEAEVERKSEMSIPRTSSRPQRVAAAKASAELKEKSLSGKLRQDMYVKLERISNIPVNNIAIQENDANSLNIKKEKLSNEKQSIEEINTNKKDSVNKIKISEAGKRKSNDDGIFGLTSHSDTVEPTKKVDESLLMISQENIVVILSDNDEKMPPPIMPPPNQPIKKSSRRRGKKNTRSGSIIPIQSIKTEDTTYSRSTRSKKAKGRNISNVVAIKEEITIESTDTADKERINNQSANTTQDTVYEDAIDGSKEHNNNPKLFESVVVLDKINYTIAENQTEINSTYVNEAKNDATFLAPIGTYKVNNKPQTQFIYDETFNVEPINNATVVLYKGDIAKSTKSSLITDDESDDEPLMPPPSNTKKKELFNPCIQSPLKKKVEAFEKHASAMQSPVVQRQTRTKTRVKKESKENHPQENIKTSSKPSTPSMELRPTKLCTPLGQSAYAPIFLSQNSRPTPNSATRLAHLNKHNSVSKISHSRDTSVEDVKRGIQALADEKKKKREEKLRQVQQQREIKQKEKQEKYKKQLQEKEEKELARKKLAKEKREKEAENRKQIEDMNRNLKLLEFKQKEKAEQLDNQRILAEKNTLQLKLKQNYHMMKQKIGHKNFYCSFEMLDSGDSTDDETKLSKKRPPFAEWSLSSFRAPIIEIQSYETTNVIDNFFSVQPMQPDLREIFPSIDPRNLKRNSSAVWNTPPRYSRLPKY